MTPLDKEEIEQARSSFNAYNVGRIYAANGLFTQAERDFLAAVPILLHHNYDAHGILECPEDAPCGIALFEPRPRHIIAFNVLLEDSFVIDREVTPFIQSLALVGSLGTVAQTKKSDFDFVLFADRDNIPEAAMVKLRDKLDAIERWSMNAMQIESHFFISDITEFRNNRFGKTDKEHVGTAMGKMFKDEFYRTAIFVAGKRPMWWITPAGLPEEEYESFRNALALEKPVDPNGFVELGHVLRPDRSEFFGGALWQMSKSIQYPFKSLLKMALLEAYLLEAEPGLLCEELKRRVLSARGREETIDPYFMMYERIDAFYTRWEMKEEVQLLRGAFLMKAGIGIDDMKRLLEAPENELNEKEKTLAALLKGWNLNAQKIAALRQGLPRSGEKRYQPHAKVNSFFLEVYRRLSDWLRSSAPDTLHITQEDMTVLGRKLFAYFQRRNRKIYFIYAGDAPDTVPREILVIREDTGREKWTWSMYDYHPITHESGITQKIPQPLFNCESLMEILSWMVVNRFWTPGVRLRFRGGGTTYEERDVRQILHELHKFFMLKPVFEPSRSDYLSDNRVVKAFVVPNFGYAHPPGRIERIDIVLLEAWGEYTHHRLQPKSAYVAMGGIMDTAEELNRPFHLKIVPPVSQSDPRLVQEFEFSVSKARKAAARTPGGRKKSKLDLI